MSAPKDYKRPVHMLEKHGEHNKVAYRNGAPVFMILECPEKEHESSNVVVLRKIKNIEVNEAVLLAMILGALK